MDIAKLKKEIDRHKIVSFDIFDTILKRNIRNPHDVFDVIQREWNNLSEIKIEDFREKRIKAEYHSRKTIDAEDVTLEEIYSSLPYDKEVREKLMAMELQIESSLLTVNQAMKEVYDYALSTGKIIVLLSDMYLSKDFIEFHLYKWGYRKYSSLYVSSQLKKTKRTGSLFKYLLEQNHYTANQIIHIGDSWKSDYLAPRRFGIHSYHIGTYTNHTLYAQYKKTDNLDQNILSCFINNQVYGERFFRIGYETLGPLLYGFCEWLHMEKKRLRLQKILFFSRDGQIIQKAYKALYPLEDTTYIYVSRRSLTVPLIWMQNSLPEVLKTIPIYQFYNEIQVIIDRLGLDYNHYKEIVSQYGFEEGQCLHKKEFFTNSHFEALYEKLKNDILINSKVEFKTMNEYINELHLESQVGVVDIGWNGTMQQTMQNILNIFGKEVSLYGFYLGINKSIENGYGFLYDTKQDELKYPLRLFVGLFELLFSADHGSVKRYISKKQVDFYNYEFDYNEKTQEGYKIIKQMQDGAIAFVNDYRGSSTCSYIHWNRDVAFRGICNLGLTPQRDDLRKMKDLYFFDNQLTQLIPGFSLKDFFSKRLIQKFVTSPWKMGLILKIIPFHFSCLYLKVYKCIRQVYCCLLG